MKKSSLILSLATSLLGACSNRTIATGATPHPEIRFSAPDYSRPEDWAAHPKKKDPSDSIPAFFKANYLKDSSVDVFFIHPTTFTYPNAGEWNASLDNETLNKKTNETTILLQASVFNEFPVYAPRYRQAHIQAYYTKDSIAARKAFDIAYSDVKNAFIHFIESNPGRPFILASHSQGTTHAIRLLKELVDGKPLQSRLVTAYLIGMKIPDQFSSLKMCSDSTDTGCLVGWRSFRSGYEPWYIDQEEGEPMITNPLTWNAETDPAPASLNKGAVLRNMNKGYPQAADAVIHDRVLWITELNFPGSFLIRKRNYHIGDINLFYGNIRQNLRTRVSYFKIPHSQVSVERQ